MTRSRQILGLVLAAFVVVLAGDVADTCAALTADAGCCCPMMNGGGNAPCKELSEKQERSETAREEGVVTLPSAPAAALASVPFITGDEGAALPAESVAAVADASLPLYLRHCSLLN